MEYQYDVFLSHNRKDKPWVRHFYKFLCDKGLSVFFDEESIEFGVDSTASIEEGLEHSKHVLFVISPDSVASGWVSLETSIGIYSDPSAREKKIIPILLEPTDL